MIAKYSSITPEQIEALKKKVCKQIFFLLVVVDPKSSEKYTHIDVDAAISNTLYELNGMNEILQHLNIVVAMSYLESARSEYKKDNFDFATYRKLILDAGAKIKEVVVDADT